MMQASEKAPPDREPGLPGYLILCLARTVLS